MMRIQYLAVTAIVAGCVGLAACSPQESASSIDSSDPTVLAGETVAREQACMSCHSTGGRDLAGPTFKGLAGSTVTLADGSTVTVDDDYLRRAIQDPDAQVRKGFPKNIMGNAMSNRDELSQEQVDQLVAYIKAVPR